jgi:hypothetical protein
MAAKRSPTLAVLGRLRSATGVKECGLWYMTGAAGAAGAAGVGGAGGETASESDACACAFFFLGPP